MMLCLGIHVISAVACPPNVSVLLLGAIAYILVLTRSVVIDTNPTASPLRPFVSTTNDVSYREIPMFKDPLYLPLVSDSITPSATIAFVTSYDATSPFRVTDLAPGRSVRVGRSLVVGGPEQVLVPSTLTISHVPSKENAPYATLRTLFRLDKKVVAVGGKSVTISAQLVISCPSVDGQIDQVLDGELAARELASLILMGPATATSGGSYIDSTVEEVGFRSRALAGEP